MELKLNMETNPNMLEKISAVVKETLTIDNIGYDTDLFESGVLDSLSLIQLMMELETSFDITISPEELDVEDYRTVRNMSEMIERLTYNSIKMRK